MEYMSSDRYYELTTMENQLIEITKLLKELTSYSIKDAHGLYTIFSLYPEELQNKIKKFILDNNFDLKNKR